MVRVENLRYTITQSKHNSANSSPIYYNFKLIIIHTMTKLISLTLCLDRHDQRPTTTWNGLCIVCHVDTSNPDNPSTWVVVVDMQLSIDLH